MAKVALLIGVSEYEPGLAPLPTTTKDVAAMRDVLTHPEMGGFAADAVTVLQNPDRQTMETAIYRLFANRQKDDLVLFYFSGHGVLDDGGEFYLATRQTQKERGKLVPPTAVAARTVQGWMEQSKSQRQVVMLDSCFSGAFARGVKAKDSGSVDLEQYLGGKGRAILTASTSYQYALAQDDAPLSIYTRYLVEGIRTGGADLDDDGWIAVEELHTYASAKVREAAPAMTPEFYPVRDGFKILLAKSPKDDPVLKYRKQVKQLAAEENGTFSPVDRIFLDELRRTLGLSADLAASIEAEELEPYRQRQAKVERYREAFSQLIAQQYPLRDRDRTKLKRLQTLLSLQDADIEPIEAPLLHQKQAEYAQQQAERERQQRAQEQQRQAQREQQRQAEQERQRQAEQERQNRQAAERKAPSTNKIRTVDFETVTITGIENTGLFGLGKPKAITQSRRLQAEVYAEDLGNGVSLELVKIPSGRFQMGAPASEAESMNFERPQHTVNVPGFWMGKYPVTQAQYEAVMGSNPSWFKGANRPVEQVSWDEAVAFCQKLSERTGTTYRLPSEAEWEYACRAGTTTPFYFGEIITPDVVNYDGNGTYNNAPKGTYRQQTTDVGLFPPNAFGLYDLHGNVLEWCADHWHDTYEGAPTDGSAWLSSDESKSRLLRGGSWDDYPWDCRSAYRYNYAPDNRFNLIGFRVVCVAPRTP